MNCPKCQCSRSKVIDSRHRETVIYRRRECLNCRWRWSTQESIPVDVEINVLIARGLEELKADLIAVIQGWEIK